MPFFRNTSHINFSMALPALAAFLILQTLFFQPQQARAATKTTWSLFNQTDTDQDGDGISNWKEINLYHTNPKQADTDHDGINDFQELQTGHNPNLAGPQDLLEKHIYISLRYQELRYYTGPYLLDDFMISSGVPGRDTPPGEFSVLAKVPTVLFQGADYYYPNTKWNLRFKPGFYIHGAYWHSNFGHKMSHGCVNVSYQDMLPIYNWADVGTKVTILAGDFPKNLAANYLDNTLVQDGQTIFLIMNGQKYGFTNFAAFRDLGYVLKNVEGRSTTGLPEGGLLTTAAAPHLPGSWVLNGRTVFYVADSGLIPISTWSIFLANGGQEKFIVPANSSDLAKQNLSLMVSADSRVN